MTAKWQVARACSNSDFKSYSDSRGERGLKGNVSVSISLINKYKCIPRILCHSLNQDFVTSLKFLPTVEACELHY